MQQTCSRCGERGVGKYCVNCGAALPVSATDGAAVSKGDTAVDKSYTSVDQSQQTTRTRDDHSVHHTTVADHSTRSVTVHANDNSRVKHSSISLGGSAVAVLALIVVVLLVMWLVPRGGVAVGQWPTEGRPPTVREEPARQVGAEPVVVAAPGTAAVPTPVERLPAPNASPAGAPPVDTALAAARSDSPALPALVNRTLIRPGAVGVLVVDGHGRRDLMLTAQLAAAIGGSDGLFAPAFVTSGAFARVHDGDVEALREAGVTQDVAKVVLATGAVTYRSTSVAGEQGTTATVTLVLRTVRPSDAYASKVTTVTEGGWGFDEAAALRLALEHALAKVQHELGEG